MVYEEGKELPLALKTVIVIVRIADDGRGSDKYIKGSNVMETLLQTGQTNVDLYWPCIIQIILNNVSLRVINKTDKFQSTKNIKEKRARHVKKAKCFVLANSKQFTESTEN